MSGSEEEDHEYALYGTLLDPIEEDEVQARKPISVQDQVATDKHGKRRFHGAFTGGFSAGFCNTVGSLEGWTPSTFKSSRAEKAAAKPGQQKPEDFMDEEDLSEFGIAPKSIQISSNFEGNAVVGQSQRLRITEGATIPGIPVLETLLQPVQDTIGCKLLQRMGWRPGQGVGPRLSARDKQAVASREKSRPKVYGCARPEENEMGRDLPEQDPDENSEEEDESGFMYAPDEYRPYLVKPKDNEFGLGYKGLDRKPVLSNDRRGFSLFDVDSISGDVSRGAPDTGVTFIGKNNKKIKIHGQAFGVGAFEAEDEDIYATDDLSRYDLSLAPSGTRSKAREPRPRGVKGTPAPGSEGALPGFRLSSASSLVFTKVFPPPVLPPNYAPRPPTAFLPHMTSPASSQAPPTGHHPITKARSAFERAAMLDEPLPIQPVSLPCLSQPVSLPCLSQPVSLPCLSQPVSLPVKAEPSDGHDQRDPPRGSSDIRTTFRSTTKFSQDSQSSSAVPSQGQTSSSNSSEGQTTFQGQTNSQGQIPKDVSAVQSQSVPDGKAFRPFASEPKKQKRYEQFVVFLKLGMKEKLTELQPKTMTEWERQREAAEFTSAHALYTPLSGAMADRFTRGSQPDDTNPLVKVEKSLAPGEEVLKNAARSKMFGKLTRETTVWVPCDLLCKRFNIKPPVFDYRNPSFAQKKRRNTNHSLFEFLNAPSTTSSTAPSGNLTADENSVPQNEETIEVQGVSKSGQKEMLPNPFREDGAGVTGHPMPQSRLEDIPLTAENKIDLFRAIFLSSDEEEEPEEKDDQRIEEVKDGSKKVDKKNEETDPSDGRGVNEQAKLGETLVKEQVTDEVYKDELKSKSCDKPGADNPMKLIDKQMLKNSNRDDQHPNLEDADNSYGPRLPANVQNKSADIPAVVSAQNTSNIDQTLFNASIDPSNTEDTIRVSKIRNSEVIGVRFERPSKASRKVDESDLTKRLEAVAEGLPSVDSNESDLPVNRLMESIPPVASTIENDDENEWIDADEVNESDSKPEKDRSDSKPRKKKRKKKIRKSKRSRSESSGSDDGEKTRNRRKKLRRRNSSSSSEHKKRHKSKRNNSSDSDDEERYRSKRKNYSDSEDKKRHKSKRNDSSDSEDKKRHTSKKKHKKYKR